MKQDTIKIEPYSLKNADVVDLEFYRNAFFLATGPREGGPYTFLITSEGKKSKPKIFCTCSPGSYAGCVHATNLLDCHRKNVEKKGALFGVEDFQNSIFRRLFNPFVKNRPVFFDAVTQELSSAGSGKRLLIGALSGETVVEYISTGPDVVRLHERLGGGDRNHTRKALAKRAAEFVLTDTEKLLGFAGHKSSRQAEEASLWYVLAYHFYREFDRSDLTIAFHIDEASALGFLDFSRGNGDLVAHVSVHQSVVSPLYAQLSALAPNSWPYLLLSKKAEMLFKIEEKTEEDAATVVAFVDVSDDPARPHYHEINGDFVFDSLLYIPGLKRMVRFSDESVRLLSLHWHKRKTVKRSGLDAFLHDNKSVFSTPEASPTSAVIDLFAPSEGRNFARLIGMPIITRFERVEIKPRGIGADRDWLYLSATYSAGPCSITLVEMLAARQARQRLLITGRGIIDLESKSVADIIDSVESKTSDGTIRIRRAALLQLKPDSESQMTVSNGLAATEVFQRIAECRPAEPLRALLCGYASTLRHYQQLGIQWLLYLYDNGFGGLLCDEMGLGKTHQLLGLMIALREQRGCTQPFLIVCPTTVISHWKNIVSTFAKGLKAAIFWGAARDLDSIGPDTDIILTSYGVLRNESGDLSDRRFALAIFDEAHYLKNPETLSFGAACRISAHCKIVMTGTPIENGIKDIKALFDLVLPGYLGDDNEFHERFVQPIASKNVPYIREKLTRLLSPFILRRLKESVLDELPDKIEEIRECPLSDEQASMYHEVLASRAREVVTALKDDEKPIPFIHIFTILTLLKEICCHPALLLKTPDSYKFHTSGKWDLFTELLNESLSSDQKVVVFTQFLGMVAIMEAYLKSINVHYVTLTGSSRNRGKIVDVFNKDHACKVIVCSLKTAGVGIDLTAASVVIHYDRWWNAAREDQATDRVHRIGQKNTVLVFKLVTTGTLEDKINDLILSKKDLSDSLICVDSPDRLKSFDRRELMSLFQEPTSRRA